MVEALLAVICAQQDRIQQLEETVQQLRDEIAVLKGQKPRPQIAPSPWTPSRGEDRGSEGAVPG